MYEDNNAYGRQAVPTGEYKRIFKSTERFSEPMTYIGRLDKWVPSRDAWKYSGKTKQMMFIDKSISADVTIHTKGEGGAPRIENHAVYRKF